VLACIRAGDWQAGLAIANNTIYGLTGAFYSSDRSRIEIAKRDFHVGNLYIQPQMYGRAGRCASVRRLQYVGD
jgi:1-pyrroline-5-carboxylate dehydrogenase